ncbi:hypothetical protein ACFL0O_07265 [Thermodesulfobacteriota bacterium]
MILAAVFLLSLSSLAFEVILTRVFSISQWNHLSFMVISIALLGFAASGTFLSLLDARKKGRGERLAATGPITIVIILYSVTAITSFIIVNKLPLDYFRLPLEPVQSFYLLAAFILLALPFFFTGMVISLAYAFFPEKTGYVYFASMTGSAAGAILPALLLPVFGEGRLIILSAFLPMLLVPFCKTGRVSSPADDGAKSPGAFRIKRILFPAIFILLFFISGHFVLSNGTAIVKVDPSPYKALSQVLLFPDTRITDTRTGLQGRIDRVESPYIRFAPGLSLKFSGTLPEQRSLYRDGDNPFVLYNSLQEQATSFSRFTHIYSGYLSIPNPENVLLIQSGGGSSIPCAIASEAGNITLIQQNPHIARMVQGHYDLRVVNRNPRAFLEANNSRYDVIQVESWGTTLPGSSALTQEYLLTTQAFTEYLEHLRKSGMLIVSRRLSLPPADAVRLWATAYVSLKSLKIEYPERCIAMLRNWDTFTLLVCVKPFQNTEALKDFAQKLNFDMVFLPGITQEMANKFNMFDEPFHFLQINRLAAAYRSGMEDDFFQHYVLDVSPQTDHRPFPDRFLKWSRLKDIYKITGSRLYSLLLSGEIVVTVVFIEALLVTFALLLLPLFAIPGGSEKPTATGILYFLAVGAGFMFVELFFIKAYTLLYGDPVISFTAVLAGILVFSGVGGFWSTRIGRTGLWKGLFCLIIVLIVTFFCLDAVVYRLLGLSRTAGYVLSIVLLIPCGVFMGLPFPLGMQYLLKNPVQRTYAWAANGCVSVLAAILSAQIALSRGIPTIMVCAILAYIVALVSLVKEKKPI